MAVMGREAEIGPVKVADIDNLDIHQRPRVSESKLQETSHYISSMSHRPV